MKFLVDESTGKKLAKLLATKYDVLFVGDILKSAKDEEVLEFAEREGRILITDDKDFGRLVLILGKPSSGVIFLRTSTTNAEKRFKILQEVLRKLDAKGKFMVVREDRIRIRRP
ncbi:MAG: DUF5615 family PIN-like protein [Candidatus Jordarchaeaceae archaeon]